MMLSKAILRRCKWMSISALLFSQLHSQLHHRYFYHMQCHLLSAWRWHHFHVSRAVMCSCSRVWRRSAELDLVGNAEGVPDCVWKGNARFREKFCCMLVCNSLESKGSTWVTLNYFGRWLAFMLNVVVQPPNLVYGCTRVRSIWLFWALLLWGWSEC